MKHFFVGIAFCLPVIKVSAQVQPVFNDTTLLKPVEITSVRANDKTPVAKTTLSKSELEKNNISQDLPFILNQTPSVTVNSDAGNGIGYTGIRIRGTDASRVNVTVNGIPYNDAESQGTFFVDLPDIASSANNIQVQRGVGTSSNGTGAFGGSININTNDINTKKSLELAANAGSYGSFRSALILNSGLLGKHFTIDGRLSYIGSNGYIDRAESKLGSFFTSAAYVDTKNSLRLNVFSGKEKTYQAWYGIDSITLVNNRRYNPAGTEKDGSPYDNQTDNYTQTHYQLFYNRKISNYWKGNIAFFLTHGKGFYEEYRADQLLKDYGLPDFNGISGTDLVRRLWLDNNFYGSIFSSQYEKLNTMLIIGGNLTQYDGKHFGEIISTEVKGAAPANYRWYDLKANKSDIAGYAKWTQQLSKNWMSFVDLQVRCVNYDLFGFRNNPTLIVKNNYVFFTPKAGITFTKKKWQAYFSYGRAAKEPNRDDFETGITQQPSPEYLDDFEAGAEFKSKIYNWAVNLFYMNYKDQLALTGKINEVGAYTRTNIPSSYRAGIEIQATARFASWLSINGNISFSENKIKNYTEYLDDYDSGGQVLNVYKKSTIAYSPNVVSAVAANFFPFKNAEFNLIGKYVSKQYLDNTSNNSRILNSYYLQDARMSYTYTFLDKVPVKIFIQVNNIFSKKYEPNGYSYSYIYGGTLTTENYYLPMATINVMTGISIKL